MFRVDPERTTKSPHMILAFNQYGAGHYDAGKDALKEEAMEPVKCRCGVNKKSNKTPLSCVKVVGEYSSRCKCLMAKEPCSCECGDSENHI